MKQLITLFLFIFLSLYTNAQIGLPIQQSVLPKNSLVVDYDFSKSASYTRGSTSVNNMTGNGSGTATLVQSPNFMNSLGFVSFNGSNQYLVSPNLRTYFKSVNTSIQKSFTMSLWFYPTNLNGVIVSELDSQTPSGGWHASNMEIVNGKIYYRIWNGTAITSLNTVSLNQWYHLAMVYDGVKLKAYLNGVLQGTQTNDRQLPTLGQYYTLAASETTNMGSGGINGGFNCAQFKLHHLPLTDSEILQEYNLRKDEFDYTIHSPITNVNPTYWNVSSAWHPSDIQTGASGTFGTYAYVPWLNSSLGWVAQQNNTSQFISLSYDEPVFIKGIITQGRKSDYIQWVSQAHIETSMTGGEPWTRVLPTKSLNVNTTDDIYSPFTTPVFAKSVRVIPTTWNLHITMRMGILVKKNTFISDNLVLYFNPAMVESYSGSGTTLIDLAGNGLNGTMSNLTYSNSAFNYNGTNSQVSILDNALLEPGTGNWTIEAWFKPTQFTVNSKTVLGKFDNGGTSSIISYALRQGNGFIRADFSNGTTAFSSSDYSLSLNNWVQMVYVWDRTNNILHTYSNGVLQQSKAITITGGIRNSSRNLFLGSYNGGEYAQDFTGQIGIVRIYKKALNAAEVLKNYNVNKELYGL